MSRYFDWPASLKRFLRFDYARAEDVNGALDQLSAGMDTLDGDVDRAIKLPAGTGDQTIALATGQRAGRVLGFDAAGNIEVKSVGGTFKGDWQTATLYLVGDTFRDPVSKDIYSTLKAHTSSTIAGDLTAGNIALSVNVQDVEAAKQVAITKAGEASGSASAAHASELAASGSAGAASGSAAAALASEGAAAGSASTASTQAGIATTQAGTATTQAGIATTKAGEAASSASAASGSASSASGSASTATTQAGIATTQASNASGSASAASGSASSAASSAGTATTQAGIATTQAGIATTKAGDATSAFDNFDKRYLGAKSSDPSKDNQGGVLAVGALYFNSPGGQMRAWTGTAWEVAYLPASGYVRGPASATDGHIAVFDGATGKDIKGGGEWVASLNGASGLLTINTLSGYGITDMATGANGAADLNALVVSGMYSYAAATNAPPGAASGVIWVSRAGSSLGQIAVAPGGAVYSRGATGIGGTPSFSAWKRVALHDDAVIALAGGAIDCSLGNYFTEAVSANRTFAFANIPTGSYSCVLEIAHTSGTITMPSGTVFSGGNAPTFTSGKRHLIFFQRAASGTAGWYASALANYAA